MELREGSIAKRRNQAVVVVVVVVVVTSVTRCAIVTGTFLFVILFSSMHVQRIQALFYWKGENTFHRVFWTLEQKIEEQSDRFCRFGFECVSAVSPVDMCDTFALSTVSVTITANVFNNKKIWFKAISIQITTTTISDGKRQSTNEKTTPSKAK